MDEAMRRRIKQNIDNHGQHVILVHRSEDDPPGFLPFAYTIGNHELGFPELLLIGGSDNVYHRILNALGEIQRERGRGLQVGELVDFTAKLPARIIDGGKTAREDYVVQAGVYYRDNVIEVRQVLLPDANGRYPGDAECQAPYSLQPLLTLIH